MRYIVSCFLVIMAIMITSPAEAITVTATPNPTVAGQTVTINISATLTVTPPCNIQIDYGEGGGFVPAGTCTSMSCNITTTHTYTTPGIYRIAVRSIGPAGGSCATGKEPATDSVIVLLSTLTVNALPSSFSVPRGVTSTRTISYNFRTSPAVDTNLRSNEGQFIANGRVLGRVKRSLSVTVRNGTGRTSENITIVPGVLKRAEHLGVTRIRYVRTFSGNYISATASVNISITTEAGAAFQINRLRLYFENNRAEITVKRNYPSLKAFAEVRFTGSGLLRAYWEVDGRILSYIYKHLVYGRSVVFETPRIPPLPTFDPGTHFLKFVIVEPEQDIPLPTAIYYVASEEYRKGLYRISLVSPSDDARIPYVPLTFQWKTSGKPALYLVEFFEAGERPIFSAYTKDQKYRVNERVLRVFSRGKEYLWKVKAFDDETNVVSESEFRKFTFLKPAGYVPGQVLVAFKEGGKAEKLVHHLVRKYDLTIIESARIPTLGWQVYVLGTRGKVPELVKRLRKEAGILLVQPNYIYRTFTDPLTSMQGISRELHLSGVHNFFLGEHVIVAVIDTGVDCSHRDLQGAILAQKNYVESSSYRPEIHGTAVAGIIAARINNFGIEGIAPGARILALRACRQVSEDNPQGECYSICIARAISDAVDQNASIVNISAGSKKEDPLVSQLITASSKQGVIFVAPVGNDLDQKKPDFPASHPEVIAVAGMDFQGHCYPNRNLAKRASVVAPATNLFTTVPNNKHNYVNGTSFSSAIVSGILAIAKEKNKNLVKKDLPPFEEDLCEWEERLLRLSLCGR